MINKEITAMKNTKVDFGPRCFKCNKKVPLAQQASLRFEKTGICSHCAKDTYNGFMKFDLTPGNKPISMGLTLFDDGIVHATFETLNCSEE